MSHLTLEQARQQLLEVAEDGAHCPLCTQHVKIYKRTINAGMARSIITMYRYDASRTFGWVNVPDVVGARSREEGKLAYWGLLEEDAGRRGDGGRSGWWRVTDRGRLYVLGGLTVPKYARVFDGRVLGFDGPQVDIRHALGSRFDYAELMSA